MKYYAVAKGRKVDIYTNWNDCEKQISGFSGAIFKSFPTKEAAEIFLFENMDEKSKDEYFQEKINKTNWKGFNEEYAALKKSDNIRETEIWKANYDIEFGEKSENSRKRKNEELEPVKRVKTTLIVYTDGACTNNGKSNAKAGYGIWFGKNDKRNTSEKLIGKQTNQRAELMGPIHLLKMIEKFQDVEIRTDSLYSIKCVTEWSKKWIVNNWKTSTGKDVENQDLIKELLKLMKSRSGKTLFKHVRGHSGNYGNDQADDLAKKALN